MQFLQYIVSLTHKEKIIWGGLLFFTILIAITLAIVTNAQNESKKSLTKYPLPPNEDIANPQLIWNVKFRFDNASQTLSILSIQQQNGFSPDYFNQPQNEYMLRILDSKEKEIYQLKFATPHIFTELEKPPPTFDFTLIIPYLDQGKMLELINPTGQTVEQKSLPKRNSLVPARGKIYAQYINPTIIIPRQCTGNALNLLFIGQYFPSDAAFVATVQNHAQTLLQTPPFSTNNSIFEIAGVNVTSDLNCATAPIGQITQTCADNINTYIQNYPHDVTMVLLNREVTNAIGFTPPISVIFYGTSVRTSSSTQPGNNVLVHEFGHALGDFLDQYIVPNPPPSPKNNCTTAAGVTMWQNQYGAANVPGVEGCTSTSFYRATENGSLMNTPVFDWNGPLHFDIVEDHLWEPILTNYSNQCIPHVTPSSTAAPTPLSTPTPTLASGASTPTPPAGGLTPTPATQYECHEVTVTQPGTQLQLQKLQCDPAASSNINFSSPTLDWEDVIALLNANNLLITLSDPCRDDLKHASRDEVGNEEGYLLPPTDNSRIGLCWRSRNCIEHGYSAYDGSVPLPTFTPSPSCQEELRSVFQHIAPYLPTFNNYQLVYSDVFNSDNTNCDKSDEICVSLAQFCADLTNPIYSSFRSICP